MLRWRLRVTTGASSLRNGPAFEPADTPRSPLGCCGIRKALHGEDEEVASENANSLTECRPHRKSFYPSATVVQGSRPELGVSKR